MSSLTPSTPKVADYFFVAGVYDSNIISTFELAKKCQTTGDNDAVYYQQQEEAVANSNQNVTSNALSESPPYVTTVERNGFFKDKNNTRQRGCSLSADLNKPPPLRSAFSDEPTSASLLKVLDHVQNVIDNFEHERDTARDNVIVAHNPKSHSIRAKSSKTLPYAEKCKKSENEKITTPESNRRRTYSLEESTRRMSKEGTLLKDWKNLSDPKIDKKRHRVSVSASTTEKKVGKTESTGSIPSTLLEKELVPNIFDLKYTPNILTRFPKTNCSPKAPFPAYAAMFCFPRDISLYHGEMPPPEQVHYFAMTDENGETVYGTCVVFYERLTEKLKEPVNNAIQEWVKSNMTTSEIEYAQHLSSKIEAELIQLNQAQKDKAQITSDRLSKQKVQSQIEEIEECITVCLENVKLYNELLEPVKMGIFTSDNVWVPKAIGLLGRMSWIDLYSDWLKILLDNIVGVGGIRPINPTIDIESTVVNLIEEVPLPPPGRFEIGLTINGRSLFFSRPPINQVPILKNFSLFPLFRALSPHLILAVLETLLAEGKVVFLSKYSGMLSFACESFRYLLFPFYWQFVFIPVLPERLLTCLQAPVPYIIGFQGSTTELEDHAPEDACIVNLDSNSMHQSQRSMTIPDRQRRKLQSALEQYAPMHTKCKIPYGVPLPVQYAFPHGKMILNSSRSKTTDVFISPAKQSRDSVSSDNTSIWSHPASLMSRPAGFWSNNASTRSSNESSTSLSGTFVNNHESKEVNNAPTLPQYPGSALLSIGAGNYASSSTSSLQSPPISPIITTASIQSSLSTASAAASSKQQPQRASMPTPIITAASSGSNDNLGLSNTYRKTENRRSDPPTARRNVSNDIGAAKNRLSAFMSAPKVSMFHNDEISSANTMVTSPRISISAPRAVSNAFDHEYHNEVPRRVKHIEGHVMAEIFSSELGLFQAYRCICGKQVTEEETDDDERKLHMFMCCQECHLVTHDACTNQVLHPCLPACFDEQKVHDAFIRVFASLLYNYRTGFTDRLEDKQSISANNTNGTPRQKKMAYFSKDRFLKHSDKDTRDFLSNLSNSQMFTQFITDRISKPSQEPEILVFDEYIKLKLNRSKLKFVKEETPFLDDDSFRLSQIIWAPPPDTTTIRQRDCKRFPTNLQFYTIGEST